MTQEDLKDTVCYGEIKMKDAVLQWLLSSDIMTLLMPFC